MRRSETGSRMYDFDSLWDDYRDAEREIERLQAALVEIKTLADVRFNSSFDMKIAKIATETLEKCEDYVNEEKI